jgi:hypothetical protein
MKSPGIEIIEVNSNQHFQDFLRLPYLLNKNNACWVPPLQTSVKKILSSRQNPFWKTHHKHLFLAFNNGKPVGRIAAIYSDQVKEEGHFGYLDAVEDPAIFTMLLHTVTGILKDRGCRRVLGPFNPNFHQEMGILVEGFDKSP